MPGRDYVTTGRDFFVTQVVDSFCSPDSLFHQFSSLRHHWTNPAGVSLHKAM
jgi:hypothetical protein